MEFSIRVVQPDDNSACAPLKFGTLLHLTITNVFTTLRQPVTCDTNSTSVMYITLSSISIFNACQHARRFSSVTVLNTLVVHKLPQQRTISEQYDDRYNSPGQVYCHI